MIKILTIIGARPQFIKARCISSQILCTKGIIERVVHTGQHYDMNMSENFMSLFPQKTDVVNLNIQGKNTTDSISKMMIGISSEILTFKPTLVLIYGDTNSTLSGALAASKNEIPIVHIEGGVRNFDMKIPEEVNRVVSDRLSDIIFCSSNKSLENLKNEGFNNFETDIVKTDDLLTDSVFQLIKDIREKNIFKDTFSYLIPNKYVLLTIHRKLSLSDECLSEVFGAINELAKDYTFVFPIHPNTSNRLQEKNIKLSDNINYLSPQNYENMLALIDNCFAIITDSGGVQREAYLLKKRSLLVLGYTPWEELIHNQCASVCNVNKDSIISGWKKMLHLSPNFDTQLYGNGNGAKQIIDKIIRKFS